MKNIEDALHKIEEFSKEEMDEIIKLVDEKNYVNDITFDDYAELLNKCDMKKRIKFANGILDLNTMELHTDGEYDFSVNYNYDPKAECYNFMQNMSEWMSAEYAERIRKWLACLLTFERPKKAMVFTGGLGKSKLLDFICGVFGWINMHEMPSKPKLYDFHCANNKLYVLVNSFFQDGDMKRFIDGEPITAKDKYARYTSAYQTMCPPIIFDVNKLNIDKNSDGFYRRFEVVIFNTIPSDKQISFGYNTCTEKAGIMNWIIGA